MQCDWKLYLTRKWINYIFTTKAFYFSAVDHSFWTSCFTLFVLSFSHLLCFNISFIVHTIIIITNWICQTRERRKMETWMAILHSIIIEWLIEIDQLLSAYFSLSIEHVFQTVITYRQNIMYMNTDNVLILNLHRKNNLDIFPLMIWLCSVNK